MKLLHRPTTNEVLVRMNEEAKRHEAEAFQRYMRASEVEEFLGPPSFVDERGNKHWIVQPRAVPPPEGVQSVK